MSKVEILIIDDEPAIRKLLEIALESNDYKVWKAATGREGETIAANHPPELIILDLGKYSRNMINCSSVTLGTIGNLNSLIRRHFIPIKKFPP